MTSSAVFPKSTPRTSHVNRRFFPFTRLAIYIPVHKTTLLESDRRIVSSSSPWLTKTSGYRNPAAQGPILKTLSYDRGP